MNLSATQVQNVLRTYQKQVREERENAILAADEEPSRAKDRVDISHEGRKRLEGDPSRKSKPNS